MAMNKRGSTEQNQFPPSYLLEVAWEVCNQVGGIYTVIRSKAPEMVKHSQGNYCMIGPYVNRNILAELELLNDSQDSFGLAATALRKKGYDVQYAQWLITGRPKVVLLNPNAVQEQAMNVVKYLLWKNHGISTQNATPLINQVIAFGFLTKLFIDELIKVRDPKIPVVAHFHEWMAGLPILDLKKDKVPVHTIFTTHATQLGRHLAINSPFFYSHLPFFRREEETKKFGIEIEENIEYNCSKSTDVMSTVSEVTARECKHLLRRKADVIMPNGLNIERFEALHEFQNMHVQYKEQIHRFIMGHFFQSYSFDLDKTLYFVTSGRFEFRNKGFDLTLEALSRLNKKLKDEGSDKTIVMFFVTKREFSTIHPEILQSKALLQEIQQTVSAIQTQIGQKLFYESTVRRDNQMPDLNDFVEEYWKLRYRRIIQSWKTRKNPLVITHKLVNEAQDEILNYLNTVGLTNAPEDRVKVVYHPDFIQPGNPLFGMDYNQFIRGCHLGIFPSYYEPWGYTPLECMASGVPSVTSDLSGFGDYLLHHLPNHSEYGLSVIERGKRTFDWSANQLMEVMYHFTKQDRRERIRMRNTVEANSGHFDWKNLIKHYKEAYQLALGISEQG